MSRQNDQPEAGPSFTQHVRRTALALDDDEDTRVEIIDESAGKIIGKGRTLRESWRRHFAKRRKKGGHDLVSHLGII